MNQKRYQAVLFDFDYTLGDSTDAIWTGYTRCLEALGYPAPAREAVRLTIGYTLQDGFTMLTGDASEEKRAQMFPLFQQYGEPLMVDGTALFPGCGELLRALRAGGITAAVVSTKLGRTIDAIFRHGGLREDVALIVGAEDVKAHKPDPEGLNGALRTLGIDKGGALFCGDTVIDAETAQRAGVDFCAVLNGTTGAQAFANFPHVHIAADLIDLKNWLNV